MKVPSNRRGSVFVEGLICLALFLLMLTSGREILLVGISEMKKLHNTNHIRMRTGYERKYEHSNH